MADTPQSPHTTSLLGWCSRELSWLLALVVQVYLTLVLVTYHPYDPAWSQSGAENEEGHVHNAGGALGAFISDIGFYLYGYSLMWWVVAGWVTLIGHYYFRRRGEIVPRSTKYRWVAGFFLLLLGSCGLEALYQFRFSELPPQGPGGIVGTEVRVWGEKLIGIYGITLFLILCCATGWSMITRLSWLHIIERLGAWCERWGIRFYIWMKNYWAQKYLAPASGAPSSEAGKGLVSKFPSFSARYERIIAGLPRFFSGNEPSASSISSVKAAAAAANTTTDASPATPGASAGSDTPEAAGTNSLWQDRFEDAVALEPLKNRITSFWGSWKTRPAAKSTTPGLPLPTFRLEPTLGTLPFDAEPLAASLAEPPISSTGLIPPASDSAPATAPQPASQPAAQASESQPVAEPQPAPDSQAASEPQAVPEPQAISELQPAQPAPETQPVQPETQIAAALAAVAPQPDPAPQPLAATQALEPQQTETPPSASAPQSDPQLAADPAHAIEGIVPLEPAPVAVSTPSPEPVEIKSEESSMSPPSSAPILEKSPVSAEEPLPKLPWESTFEPAADFSPVADAVPSAPPSPSRTHENSANGDDDVASLQPLSLADAVTQAYQPTLRKVPADTASSSSPYDASPLPPMRLLDPSPPPMPGESPEKLESMAQLIESKLREFGVNVNVVAWHPGPVITRFEIEPASGVKGSQIVNLVKDLARALSVVSIRVVETIPGRNTMGLEIPNPQRQIVRLSSILNAMIYRNAESKLTLAMGQDIAGNPQVADLAKMPHALVAGTTGSGKSVAINAMILSLLFKATPEEVRLIMIDPKMLELSVYEGIPHLLAPVVTDMKLAAHALNWCVGEMERRYRIMSLLGVRNLAGYNQKIKDAQKAGKPITNPATITPDSPEPLEPMPMIVVIIDELADLMMVAGKKIEELIARLAQKARAAGIHLILATQRPSVDVITGLIKANVPSRVAFQVSSKIDSRTILDQMGAEALLGQGDMLYLPPGTGFTHRLHGAFVADPEVHRVVDFWKSKGEPNYVEGILEPEESATLLEGGNVEGSEEDPLYDEAVSIVIKSRRASISLVQRQLRIGYNRAARLIEQMEGAGLVSPMQSNGNRDVLVPPHSGDH